MKRQSVSFVVIFLFVFLVAIPVVSEEHTLVSKYVDGHNAPAFPTVIYEYVPGSVRISLDILGSYFPSKGSFWTSRGGETYRKGISFHGISSSDDPPWIASIINFDDRYTIEHVKGSGAYVFDVFFTDSEPCPSDPCDDEYSWTSARFDVYFPTFEPVEYTCRLDKKHIAVAFTVYSMETLPDSVESISIQREDGRDIVFDNVQFAERNGGFGRVVIPVRQNWYRQILAGKKMTTRWTISGETVDKTVNFPLVVNVPSLCGKG